MNLTLSLYQTEPDRTGDSQTALEKDRATETAKERVPEPALEIQALIRQELPGLWVLDLPLDTANPISGWISR